MDRVGSPVAAVALATYWNGLQSPFIWDDDTATTNLFQPAIGVAKSCDDLSKIGDDVFCTVTVTNSGSSDSPNLVLDSNNDTIVGNLNGVLTRGVKVSCPPWPIGGLAPGATWTCTYKFTVISTDATTRRRRTRRSRKAARTGRHRRIAELMMAMNTSDQMIR